ncbi:MAG: ATP synthase F1 subunit delta [Bdellovibrionales bacterium]
MRNILLATRYARALYGLAAEKNEQDAVFEKMRALSEAFSADAQVSQYLFSPVVRPADKVAALEKLVAALTLPESLQKFVLLLAKKNRLGVFKDIVTAYQQIADDAHGVTRGTVRSATVLDPDERKRIETLVGRATKKQVILNYKEDPALLGGLVAEVGSFTFDDSLISHLKRINEQLNRSVQ